MSIKYGFFNSVDGDRKYNAEDFTNVFKGILNDGVFYDIGNKFNCSLVSTEEAPIRIGVSTGRAMFNGKYFEIESTEYVILETNASQTLKRIDYIGILIDESNRTCSLKVFQGTPSESPEPPSISLTNGQSYYPICSVSIDENAVTTPVADKVKITSLIGTNECPWASVAYNPKSAMLIYEGETEVDPTVISYYADNYTKSLSDADVKWNKSNPSDCVIEFDIPNTSGQYANLVTLGSLSGSIWAYSNNPEISISRNSSGITLHVTIHTHAGYTSNMLHVGAIVSYINIPAIPL